MTHLIDRYFLKQPMLRRLLTRLVAENREEKVTLLATEYLVHSVREHGFRCFDGRTLRPATDETSNLLAIGHQAPMPQTAA